MATSADAARTVVLSISWERCQEQALQAFRTGDATSARRIGKRLWRSPSVISSAATPGSPPASATTPSPSFAEKSIHQANNYFQQAMIAWEETWCWIPWDAPSTKADEVEATPYDRETQEGFYALIRRGQAITETLWRENQLSDVEGDDWSKVKAERHDRHTAPVLGGFSDADRP